MKNLLLYPIKQSCDIDKKISNNIKSAGENTGNLIFVNAVQQQLSNFIIGRNIYSPHEYRGEMKDEITSAIIPASNWLNATDEVIVLVAGFVDKQKFPVTLAGLGAQSTKELNTPRKLVNHLGSHKIYAMQSLSANCRSIGIRGEFTAECLELMNISNYNIIGCPSAYIYPGDEWKKDLKATADKILFNVTTGNVYETHILTLGWQRNAKWIMQSMEELPKTVFERASMICHAKPLFLNVLLPN